MISFDDLLPLLPLLIVSLTVVFTMIMIGIRRSFIVSGALTILGLLLAACVAMVMLPWTNQQVTPLLIIDQYSLLFTIITCVASMFIAVFSFPYFFRLDDQKEEFYLLIGLATVGAIVMVSSNHFISTVLGLETLSMSLYGMIAYPLHSKDSANYPLEASVKYLILSACASCFILFGMALVYAQTGTLSFTSLAALDPEFGLSEGYTVVALLLISTGMAFKLSLAPFHLWTPDVYEGSPLPATAYLATVGKMAMAVLLLRFLTSTEALSFGAIPVVFSLIAIASIIVGNLLALRQENLKRILAYSSIAHMGYLLIAVVSSNVSGGGISVEAISFYLIAYVVMSLGAFAILSTLSSSENEIDQVGDYQGLFWRSPWLATMLIAMLLSLAGIPLTVGFIGKFYIFFAGVESSLWVLLAALVIGSGIGLYYYLRIVYIILQPLKAKQQTSFPIAGIESLSSYFVIALLFLLLIILGVYPSPLVSLVKSASGFI
ncbi:MAG: NADH-quinone oxidoreductase subunit N [Paracoccaceae bacterium]|jgi:NADH-quinone oxidoreductase subunit N